MKNPIARYALQFTAFFLIIGIIFVAVGGEDNPPIWNRTVGDYIMNVLGIVLVGMVIFALPILIQAKRVGDKHKKYHDKYNIPYANDKGQCYCGQ